MGGLVNSLSQESGVLRGVRTLTGSMESYGAL